MYAAAVILPLAAGAVALYLVCSNGAKAVAAPPFFCTATSGCVGAAVCKPDGKSCSCPPGFTGADCSNPPQADAGTTQSCIRVPRPCDTDTDCVVCAFVPGGGGGTEYVCTELQAAQTGTGVAGKHCTPAQPVNTCRAVPDGVPASEQIPGEYFWQGWKDVEAMAWTCNCPFPEYYPEDATDGGCKRSENLCRGGTWAYPTRDGNTGASPLTYGACDCNNTKCATSADCVTGAACGATGMCIQRVAMDSSGVPTCSPDTCAPGGKWVAAAAMSGTALAGAYGACQCNDGFESMGTACVIPRKK
jgi:hypothetical protein